MELTLDQALQKGIEAHKAGEVWTTVPDFGAALRGVRWTERAVRAMPILRPH